MDLLCGLHSTEYTDIFIVFGSSLTLSGGPFVSVLFAALNASRNGHRIDKKLYIQLNFIKGVLGF